jgi:hypothetical protein
MNNYFCIVCMTPFQTEKVLSTGARFCSCQCREIDRLPSKSAFKYEFLNKNRNRVFEVTPWEKPKQYNFHSRRKLRIKGHGGKQRITSKVAQ